MDFKQYLPKLQPYLDKLQNYMHVPLACICQGVILYLDRSGHAISASTQQTVNWFYLFLGGHFGASQLWPDKPSDPPAPPTGGQ